MLTPADIDKMEDALAAAGASVDQLCEAAGVNRSTWTRWKAGTYRPLWSKWEDVTVAFDKLTESKQ